MPPVDALVILSTTALAGIGMVGGLVAWGWSAWLRLRRQELELARDEDRTMPGVTQRIDVADLKERIRKLEAIASGVEI